MSPDGYIRLPLGSLVSLPFVHLFSHTDTGFMEDLRDTSVAVSAAGYSEWKSETRPDISLGWGWFVQAQSGQMLLAPDGVRSNLMLIDTTGYDLGPLRTSSLLHTWLQAFEWQGTVKNALHKNSACQL
jgi:hypothetical protein